MTRITIATLVVAFPILAMSHTENTPEQNKAVIRERNERIKRDGPKAGGWGFADGLKHQGQPVTRESRVRVMEDIFTTFPDYRTEIVDMVAEGDSVVVRSKVSGTHLGVGQLAVNGAMLVGVAPTGKRFVVENIHWYKLRDGAIVEHYAARDDIGMMRQLGLLPSIGLPTAR